MLKWKILILIILIGGSNGFCQNHTIYNIDKLFYDASQISLMAGYDANDGQLMLPPYNLSIRYEAKQSENKSFKRISREKNMIYQFDLVYRKNFEPVLSGNSETETNLIFKLGQNIITYRKNRFRLGLNAFLGYEIYNGSFTAFTFDDPGFSNTFLFINGSTDLDLTIRISDKGAFKIAFPIPILDYGYQRYRNKDPNIPIGLQKTSFWGAKTFDFSRKFRFQFGFTKSF